MLIHKPSPSKILPKNIKKKSWDKRHSQRLNEAIKRKEFAKSKIIELGLFLELYDDDKYWIVKDLNKKIVEWCPDTAKLKSDKLSGVLTIRDVNQFINAVRMINNLKK